MNFGSPPPRTYVLIFGAILATATLFVASNLRDPSTTLAQTQTYNICERTTAVRDAIIAKLGSDTDTSATYSTAATAHTAGGAACASIFRTVSATDLGNASWPQGGSTKLNLRNMSLTSLDADDFAGLSDLRHVDLTSNDLVELPDGIFADTASLAEVVIENNQRFRLRNEWFQGGTLPGGLILHVGNSGISRQDIEEDFFDKNGNFRHLGLKNNNLGHINTRWFERINHLSWGINLDNNLIDTHYYSKDGAAPTNVVEYASTPTGQTALSAAIRTAAVNYRATLSQTLPGHYRNPVVSTYPDVGFNLCDWEDRPVVIRNEIIKGMKRVQPTIYGDAGTYRGPGNQYSGFGCGTGQSASVNDANLAAHSSWIYPNWSTQRFDARNAGLTEIKATYFKGLTSLELLDLRNNKIETIEDDALEGLGVEELLLNNNRLGGSTVDPGEWLNNSCTTVHNLDLGNNGIRNRDIPYDAFDCFSAGLWALKLMENPLGYLNIRWFERLYVLRWDLALNDSQVASYYDANSNTIPNSGLTTYLSGESLRTAIRTKASTWATANSVTLNSQAFTASKYKAPIVGIDICDRPKPIWADLMRELGYIYDEFDGADTSTTWAGDVRHARWDHLADATFNAAGVQTAPSTDCVVMPAVALLKSDGSIISPTAADTPAAFNSNLHEKAIYHKRQFWSNGDSRMDINLAGADGLVDSDGVLDPSNFRNFQYVARIYLGDTGIKSIPADTFAEARRVRFLYLNDNQIDNLAFSGESFLSPLNMLAILDMRDNALTEFKSSWLNPAARTSETRPLRELLLSGNPLRSTDLAGLTGLTQLRLNRTLMTQVDPAIFTMDQLVWFWWETDAITLNGLHPNGIAAYFDALPRSIRYSVPPKWLGNVDHFEDAELDAETVAASFAHHEAFTAINAADDGNDFVSSASLNDPCRPSIRDIHDTSSWAQDYGPLCLTNAQKDAFISSLTRFNGLNWLLLSNSDLSNSQMARLLRNIQTKPIDRLRFISNPNAFGNGFDDTALSAFDNARWLNLWNLRLVNAGLNFSQAQTILNNLANGAFANSNVITVNDIVRARSRGLTYIDLSYNDGLFTGVTPAQLENFLKGVTRVGPNTPAINLNLAGTDLNFDQLLAIVNSIETHRDDPTENVVQIRHLDVSQNPNLWNRWDADNNEWDDVSQTDIQGLIGRFKGLTSLNIGGTGLSATDVSWVLTRLGARTTPFPPGLDSTLARITSLSLRDTDLSAASLIETDFASFATEIDTRRPALRELDLANTNINLTRLIAIVAGLETADALTSVQTLDLSENPGLFEGCTPGGPSDNVETTLAKFTNLRSIKLDRTIGDFTELQCVVNGLNDADPAEGAPLIRTFSIATNPRAFLVVETVNQVEVETEAEENMVVALFTSLPNAKKILRNTGITVRQAQAVLEAEKQGQTLQRQLEIERAFSAQNPAFTFKTPLPEDVTVESGRGSLRVKFTHNPMRDGEPFTVLRYEFRYRVRPTDASAPWGGSDGEAWRTASVDLSETGEKSFAIYGLDPETIYQVQLRASSLALPATASSVGGTWTSLPEINEIKPAITDVSVRAGDLIRLEVDVYGLSDIVDNTLPDKDGSKLIFTWSDGSGGGDFADPGDSRRVMYTAPGLPGTYTLMVEAQPDGICTDHHKTTFDISSADRARCQAMFTVRVSRAASDAGPPPEPVNPAGIIPTSLTDNAGTAYAVFTPIEGGTFSGDGITVSAAKGAIPDGQLLGVAASVSPIAVPDPTPGTRLTLSGSFYDVMGVQRTGDAPVSGYVLDEPLSVCLPLPTAFRANVSDIVIVNRASDGSLGILSSTLRQSGGSLTACGSIGQLPATVAVAKTGIVEEPMVDVPGDAEPPPTGGTGPSSAMFIFITLLAGILLATVARLVLGGTLARGAPRERA